MNPFKQKRYFGKTVPLYDPSVLDFGDVIVDKVKSHKYEVVNIHSNDKGGRSIEVHFIGESRFKGLAFAFSDDTLRDPDRFDHCPIISVEEGEGRWQDYPRDPYYVDPDEILAGARRSVS